MRTADKRTSPGKPFPRPLAFLLMVFAVFYVIFPRDLIPDFLGVLGRVDDLVLFGFIYFRYWRKSRVLYGPKNVSTGRASRERPTYSEEDVEEEPDFEEEESYAREKSFERPSRPSPPPFDPYEILEVRQDATREQIVSNYRRLIKQYHPDRVHSLGKELKDLAHRKTLEIQRAYEMLVS